MIISHIIGGLGNQMFQYASGRALSVTRREPLRLDVSSFNGYRLHNGFELHRLFDIAQPLAEREDMSMVLGWRARWWVRRLLGRPRLAWMRGPHFVVEPHFHYWPEMANVPDDVYLEGYWQSPRYFAGHEDILRKDFVFKPFMSPRNMQLANMIVTCNAVSLHVRRGDYVLDPATFATHGACGIAYYMDAVAYAAARVKNPHFFVFSDDPDWVRQNLALSFPCEYVSHNSGEESYNDMRLMSLCRHHIIANSSFSWWGAWLNPNQDKLVIAPRTWFAADMYDTRDLMPDSWVRL